MSKKIINTSKGRHMTKNTSNGNSSNGNSSNGNAKAFGGVIAIIAVIAGVYAMIEPQQQRIDYLTDEIIIMQKETKDQIRESRNEDALSRQDRASLREKFQGITGEITALKEIRDIRYSYLELSQNN
ncbi:MAG TPA: hypothetical protein VMZ91_10150, partial [Candidatus Paceibacterota bacterium]|nr:hypothetical protein [Candidatus Paceibacterota bacterium]